MSDISTYKITFNKDGSIIKNINNLYSDDKKSNIFNKSLISFDAPTLSLKTLKFEKDIKEFERDLINFYASFIYKTINRDKRKFYKIFSKTFIEPVTTSTYNKIKGNIINFFTEMPFVDIFDIAFNRFLNDEKIFDRIMSKIFKQLMYFEYINNISVVCFDSKDLSTSCIEYIKHEQNDTFYINCNVFRKLIDCGREHIDYDINFSEKGNKYKLEINIGDKYELKINDNNNVNKPIENTILNITILYLRDVFRNMYIDEIRSNKNKLFNNIIIEITSFYLRNGNTLSKITKDITSLANGFLKNFDKKLHMVCIPKIDIDDSDSVHSYSCLYESDIAEFLAPIQEIIGKLSSISHFSSVELADTFIDVDPISNALHELSSSLLSVRAIIESTLLNKYLTNGFKDIELVNIIVKALKYYISNFISFKKKLFDSNKPEFWILPNKKFITNVDEHGIMELIGKFMKPEEFREKFEKKYGPEVYPQMIGDMETLINSFIDGMSKFIKTLSMDVLMPIMSWFAQKIIPNCETMIHYDCEIDIKNIELESSMDNDFLSMNDNVFKTFIQNYNNKFFY